MDNFWQGYSFFRKVNLLCLTGSFFRRFNPLWLTVFGRIGMAGTGACHYVGNKKQKVNVIGHHNIQIDMDPWVMLRNLVDYLFHHTTNIIQNHFSINDLPKQRFTILGDDGYKICTWLRIIEIRYSQFFSVE